jgi:2-pyrone-4,6-dicarboxylate lactonase
VDFPEKVHPSVPTGACDAHIHLFGPLNRYPAAASSPYEVPDATPAQFAALSREAGITRAVVVHAAVSGRDNRRTLDALRDDPEHLRGVITPPLDELDDPTIEEWRTLGVRGVRYSYTGTPRADMKINCERLARWADHGWHAQVHVEDEQIVELEALIRTLPGQVVIDHMARIPAAWGTQSKAFLSLLRLLDRGNVWVKLSAPMRLSAQGRLPYEDVGSMARALVKHAPDRLVWGSDWPHVNFAGELPSYDGLLGLLTDWAPDPDIRRQILVDNACTLYGFPLPATADS